MNEAFVQAIKADAIAPGGMRAIELNGREIVLCNCGGTFHAIARRCGHMNAPLDLGTVEGDIVTCPMHCAQFDVRTGEVLSGPVPTYFGSEALPARAAARLRNIDWVMQHIRMDPIPAYRVKVESGWVWVAV